MKGAHLGRVEQLFARLGHELSLPMPGSLGDLAGPNVGSDLSEGWVPARYVLGQKKIRSRRIK